VAADAQAIALLRQRVPVLGFVNNHFAGYAPETVHKSVSVHFSPVRQAKTELTPIYLN